jgi:tetratricopeptide (TPR) repeat protein
MARQWGAVISRRVGLAVGIWGELGIGKTHVSAAVLREIPCANLSLHATATERAIITALPRPKRLPVWAEQQLTRARNGEPLEAHVFVDVIAAVLAGLVPFVLHLEDAHEASPERLNTIQHLARAVRVIRGAGLLVTSRTQLPEPFINHQIEPLSREASDQLIRSGLNASLNADMPEEGLEYVFARARGNPLFTLEFVRYLTRQGYFWNDGQRWRWRAPMGDYLPVTVEALILELTSKTTLDAQARAVLEARSILPHQLETGTLNLLWAHAADVTPEALEASRQALSRIGLLHGHDFAHPLFGEVIAIGLEAQVRRSLTRRVIQMAGQVDPELVAGLIDHADLEPGEALPMLRRAATQAAARGDAVTSGRWLAAAVERTHGAERASLAFEASCLLGNRDIGLAVRLAEQAHQAPGSSLEVSVWLAELLINQSQTERAEAILRARPAEDHDHQDWWEEMVRVLSRKDGGVNDAIALWLERPALHAKARVRTVLMVALAFQFAGQADEALRLMQAQLERQDLSIADQSDIMHDLAMSAYFRGDFAAVERHLLEVIVLERTITHPYSLAESLRKLASLYVRLGRHTEALEPIREATRIASGTGHPRIYAICLGTLGTLLMQQAQFEEAETHFRERIEIMERFGNAFYLYDAHADLALLYLEWQPQHGVPLALRHAQTALTWAERAHRDTPVILALLARAQLGAGDPVRALETAQAAVQTVSSPEQNALTQLSLGLALRANHRLEAAVAALEASVREYEQLGMRYMMQRSGLELDRATNNAAQALERRRWFEDHGLHTGRYVADRLFPEPVCAKRVETIPATQPDAGVWLRVLGPVNLERDGQVVPTRARKRLEVLAYLLETRIAGRSEASTLELVDAIFPDVPEMEARNNLKQQVYLIRSSLGADSVISTPTGYALGNVSSDAETFLQHGQADLWRGAYLGSLGEGWRPGVREALTLALRARVESLRETDPAEAARLGLILLEMEPYDVDALELTVHALELSGDARLAQRVFVEGRQRLQAVGADVPETLAGVAPDAV